MALENRTCLVEFLSVVEHLGHVPNAAAVQRQRPVQRDCAPEPVKPRRCEQAVNTTLVCEQGVTVNT